MKRVFNFSAGPCTLPLEVLEEAQRDLICYKDTGMSVMEMSHRSPMFEKIIEEAEVSLRKLMKIPDNYHVLFLQGGATLQFEMCALNLMQDKTAYYVDTGTFSSKAIKEAKRYGNVEVLASSKADGFAYIPELDMSKLPNDAAYLHITNNNTIVGTQFNTSPDTHGVTLVGDMSSIILGKEYDVTKYGLIYAGAQKNMAPAGLTIAIIRDDLLGKEMEMTPTMLKYKIHADGESMFNTPPCWSIYMASLVYKWVEKQGGVAQVEKNNIKKAKLVYDVIDAYDMYEGVARPDSRSIMNITLRLPNDELTEKFIAEAEKVDLVNIAGHRSVGGLRFSIYNAMPYEGLQTMANFMEDFAKKNG